MVMVAEMVIDWLKHAFVTKFNQISPNVYSKFITILCRDLTGWKNEDVRPFSPPCFHYCCSQSHVFVCV